MFFITSGTIYAQGCMLTPNASSTETANDGVLCSYIITLCVDVPSSPSPKRIYFNIDYDTDGNSSLDENQSFEIDPPGNTSISAGNYCHDFIIENIVCGGSITSTVTGFVGNGAGSDCTTFSSTGTTNSIALPVELIDFYVKEDKGTSSLNWTTATEENTMLFVVERSLNGIDGFSAIARIEAAGNSIRRQDYIYRLKSESLSSYYRLRIIDFDGFTEFSNVIYAESRQDNPAVEVFPNPIINKINIQIEGYREVSLKIQLTDLLGRVIRSENNEEGITNGLIQWNLENLSKGVYNLTIDDGVKMISRKLIKVE